MTILFIVDAVIAAFSLVLLGFWLNVTLCECDAKKTKYDKPIIQHKFFDPVSTLERRIIELEQMPILHS